MGGAGAAARGALARPAALHPVRAWAVQMRHRSRSGWQHLRPPEEQQLWMHCKHVLPALLDLPPLPPPPPPCHPNPQIRYMLGDAGRSLLVGYGHNPPKRTQDRGAACPDPPEVGSGAGRGGGREGGRLGLLRLERGTAGWLSAAPAPASGMHLHPSSCTMRQPAPACPPGLPHPPRPQVCNRVTGLLSPDPDAHVLRGALVYGSVRSGRGWRHLCPWLAKAAIGAGLCSSKGLSGTAPALWSRSAARSLPAICPTPSPEPSPTAPCPQGRSDDFADQRDADSNWVGIENNAGLAAALAGINEVGGAA